MSLFMATDEVGLTIQAGDALYYVNNQYLFVLSDFPGKAS